VRAAKPVSTLSLGNQGASYGTETGGAYLPPSQSPQQVAGKASIQEGAPPHKLFEGQGLYVSEAKASYLRPPYTERTREIKPSSDSSTWARGGLRGTTEYRDEFRKDQMRKLLEFHGVDFKLKA
jgi:hypothetical protein